MNPPSALKTAFLRERQRWAYWLPLAPAAGIACYFALSFEPSAWFLAMAPVLALATWLMRHRSWPAAILLFVLFMSAAGFSAALIETRLNENILLDRDYNAVPIAGRVAVTEIMPDGIRLTLSHPKIAPLSPEETPDKIRLKYSELTLEDAPPTGAELNLFGRVGGLSEPVAPGGTDFRWQTYFKHLGGIGWGYGKFHIVDAAPVDAGWREKFALLCEKARKILAQHVYDRLSGDTAAMTATRLNGEQSAISQPVIEAMRVAGLAHLLSTSGFHVTIMALLIYFPVRALLALIPPLALRYPIKKWAAGVAIFSALAYTFLVGSQAATLRSMIMTGLALLAITLDRRTTPLRLVLMSALIGMFVVPDAIMGPSFQMSFAAVFCLVALTKNPWGQNLWGLEERSAFLPGWIYKPVAHLGGIARTSLIATAATTPFAIYHFQSFSLYGFAANMLAIPITSFWVMPAILMAYMTAPFGLDGIFIDAAGLGVALTIRIATMVASWPHALFFLPLMPGFAMILAVVGGAWLCIWRSTFRWLGLIPIMIGMAYPLYTRQPDLLVAPDGHAWGARLSDGRLAVPNLNRDKFVTGQWQEILGMPALVDAASATQDPQLGCDSEGCVYRKDSHVIAMPQKDDALAEDCDHADIVVTPVAVTECRAHIVIDAQSLRDHGAQAIYIDGEDMRIVASRHRRGERPWSVGWREPAAQ